MKDGTKTIEKILTTLGYELFFGKLSYDEVTESAKKAVENKDVINNMEYGEAYYYLYEEERCVRLRDFMKEVDEDPHYLFHFVFGKDE